MAVIIKNMGIEQEQVVGSYCNGSLEVEGRIYPASAIESLKQMGYIFLYLV